MSVVAEGRTLGRMNKQGVQGSLGMMEKFYILNEVAVQLALKLVQTYTIVC